MPPQGLLLVAAYLNETWRVRFVDENARGATAATPCSVRCSVAWRAPPETCGASSLNRMLRSWPRRRRISCVA
jgi:hypothetical protein